MRGLNFAGIKFRAEKSPKTREIKSRENKLLKKTREIKSRENKLFGKFAKLNPRENKLSKILAQNGQKGFFLENRAPSLFCIYGPLTKSRKSEKTNDPILRKSPN